MTIKTAWSTQINSYINNKLVNKDYFFDNLCSHHKKNTKYEHTKVEIEIWQFLNFVNYLMIGCFYIKDRELNNFRHSNFVYLALRQSFFNASWILKSSNKFNLEYFLSRVNEPIFVRRIKFVNTIHYMFVKKILRILTKDQMSSSDKSEIYCLKCSEPNYYTCYETCYFRQTVYWTQISLAN